MSHRTSTRQLKNLFADLFGLPVHKCEILGFWTILAEKYRTTHSEILENLRSGDVIHADETPVTVKTGKGYVWVFAGLEDVAYIYRPNREAMFLAEFLAGFNGVLVTDFYAAYDFLPCAHQKCLVHFIRDLNSDLLKYPFEPELKEFVAEFGGLLKSIVATIDQYGLKESRLRRHRKEADRLVQTAAGRDFQSKVMRGYSRRLAKYGQSMFTFLLHDGVTWNNAHAEHAVRESSNTRYTVPGLETYLALLSLCQTCRYRDVNFLDFLLSEEKSISKFSGRRRRANNPPEVVEYPPGIGRNGKRETPLRSSTYDTRIRIRYLDRQGKSVPEICDELDVTLRQVQNALSHLG